MSNMYTALAEVYDLFYDDDAERRAEYYAGLLGNDGGEGADLGCGTGTLTARLYRRGYKIYGIDPSGAMLSKAAERASAQGLPIKYVLGNAENMPHTRKLDFVVAACDVFNYVKNISKAFESVYSALKPGGVFAFDISSKYKLENILAGNTFSRTENDYTYIWQNFRAGDKLKIDFTVFSPVGESYIKTSETQVQYIRSEQLVEDALVKAGFRKVKRYGFYRKTKPKADTERIAFTAIK